MTSDSDAAMLAGGPTVAAMPAPRAPPLRMDERRIDAALTAAALRLADIRDRRGDAMMIGVGTNGCPSTGQRVVNFSPLRFRDAPS